MASDSILFTFGWAAEAAGSAARPVDTALSSEPVRGVCIDSRRCTPGQMFVALPGQNTDGHRYVESAMEAGCVGAVVHSDFPAPPSIGDRLIRVPDTLSAMHALAGNYRRTLFFTHRIGVTGSNGKTTTKEMLASILALHGDTYASGGNLNSETGVPLAIFSAPKSAEYAIFEMAMSNAGEMGWLAAMLEPTLAIITNIGTAHIGRLGSRRAIAEEKRKITDRFTGTEVLFIPENDDFAGFLADGVNGSVEWFGEQTQRVRIEELPESTILDFGAWHVSVPFPGYHNAMNALATIRVSEYLGVPHGIIRDGIESTDLPFGRSKLIRGERTVLVDCYNANPESMSAAIRSARRLTDETGGAGLVLVLGAMKELGKFALEAHRNLLAEAIAACPAILVLIGEEFDDLDQGSAYSGTVIRGTSAESVADRLQQALQPGQVVLLKGSRALALEQLTQLAAGGVLNGEVRDA